MPLVGSTKATEHMQSPLTWGSQWSQAAHIKPRAELSCLCWNVLYFLVQNSENNGVENWWRGEAEYFVPCFRAVISGIHDLTAEGRWPVILRSIKYENKNTSTLLLLLMFITTSSQAECLWRPRGMSSSI